VNVSAYWLAERFTGLREVAGPVSNAQVLAMLRLDRSDVQDDETPWCSAFVNYVCWLLRLPRSHSLAARSWLGMGRAVELDYARTGFDVVVLNRGLGQQPGPEVLDAPGHVGFYSSIEEGEPTIGAPGPRIWLLGGNQGNAVTLASFDSSRVLGVRRLREE
jgi:uncharacterized protein (TIGR02594 family)